MKTRMSGILLHISSLPSNYGIGDLGPEAHAFIRLLSGAGLSLWQVLPLHPTSSGLNNSPYSSPSAFAGNQLFISPELLMRDGLIVDADLEASREQAEQECRAAGIPAGVPGNCDVAFGRVERERAHLLRLAYERNRGKLDNDTRFKDFCEVHRYWLDDYARFVTIKEEHNGAMWTRWPEELKRREPAALGMWDHTRREAILREKFIQFLFFTQWAELRRACHHKDIQLIGDMPIYITHDSADVWANPGFFNLDGDCNPITVAGVPPDYFSATGQRWGNPVYRWEALRQDGFYWWQKRIAHNLLLVDRVRIDHFRGFAGYWEIPANEETAVNGRWVEAPGMELFSAMSRRFTSLPFIAEDLGVITPDVRELKKAFDLPGMHVLQFAFGGTNPANNPDIPFRHTENSVVYTGTHDNAPTKAWFATAGREERENLTAYAGLEVSEENVCPILIRLAFESKASLAIIPAQDVLGLGSEARMNTPALAAGNWTWRLTADMARAERFQELSRWADLYGRHSRK